MTATKLCGQKRDGKTVNRLENIFMMGTSHASNEECALMHQALRSLGIVSIWITRRVPDW